MSATLRIWTRAVCIVHACVVSGTWYVIFMLDKDIVNVRIWTALAVLWPIWIFAIAFPGKAWRLRWLATLALGLIILSPTFSTLYSFAVWTIGGFAP